ncbi:MAG: archaeosine biosynthesis radical SAM protein RaSEA, partial [Candidatus Heimdallarchaeota archaeon]
MVTQKGIFTEHICTQRKLALRARKAHNKTQAIAAWIEKDHLLTGPGDALVIILNSLGCQWGLGSEGGCSMCGYSNETSKGITETDLIAQVDSSLTKFANKTYTAIKIFNSGSFLDESEIPIKAQDEIIKLINQVPAVLEIIIESRPEFVTTKALSRLTKLLSKEKQLEIGIGLESSNDAIRINNINKGFLFTDYQKAVKIALKHNVRVKTYLLLKPPFMTEKEAIEDTIKSAIAAIKTGSRSLSINPVNIQNGTMVFHLWRKGLYRSPWYWSLQKVILEIWNHLEEEGMTDKVD